jgi:large subunit ribosomal protein L30
MVNKEISVQLTKSLIGSKGIHRKSVHGLGLTRVGQIVNVVDTPENRGMIAKAHHLVTLI